MSHELVSVILPTYNRSKRVQNAINSVLQQTYTNWELLVIDDCSTDDTAEVVSAYNDDRIKYVRLEKNGGVSNARNEGIKMAAGAYITFIDSDDEFLPTKIEKQYTWMKSSTDPLLKIVTCGRIDYRNEQPYLRFIPKEFPDTYRRLLGRKKGIGAGTPFLMVKADIFKTGDFFFDVSFPAMEDWDFVLKITAQYHFSVVPEILLKVNHHTEDRVHSSKNALTAIQMQYHKYLPILKENPAQHKSFINKVAMLLLAFSGNDEAATFYRSQLQENKLWTPRQFIQYMGLKLAKRKIIKKVVLKISN